MNIGEKEKVAVISFERGHAHQRIERRLALRSCEDGVDRVFVWSGRSDDKELQLLGIGYLGLEDEEAIKLSRMRGVDCLLGVTPEDYLRWLWSRGNGEVVEIIEGKKASRILDASPGEKDYIGY